jgi:hypothetical protein
MIVFYHQSSDHDRNDTLRRQPRNGRVLASIGIDENWKMEREIELEREMERQILFLPQKEFGKKVGLVINIHQPRIQPIRDREVKARHHRNSRREGVCRWGANISGTNPFLAMER